MRRALILLFFFFNDPATTEISPLPLHDAFPISSVIMRQLKRDPVIAAEHIPPLDQVSATAVCRSQFVVRCGLVDERLVEAHLTTCSLHHEDRKSTRLNSSHSQISYAVFCLKKKN